MIETSIYFNREERFFTATVFPGIVCRENFKHFHHFLNLLRDLDSSIPENIKTDWHPDSKTIIFFTEYSLKKSIHKTKSKLEEVIAGDTPDILFIIRHKNENILFAIEGKMYSQCSEKSLKVQLENQRKILNGIAKASALPINYIHHFGLVPENMVMNFTPELKSKMITWEKLYTCYSKIYNNDYYLDILKHSIDNYLELRSVVTNNSDGKLPGLLIFKEHSKYKIKRIGRGQGINGLKEDVVNGTWERREYEYNCNDHIPNKNWVPISDFIQIISRIK